MEELLKVGRTLIGPKGCPWDRKQTLKSLQPFFLEEVHEVLEAIDSENQESIIEELGDLLYAIIFCALIGEKEGTFTMEDIVEKEKEKLIRRHPHVFGDLQISSIEELKEKWEEIKKNEKGKEKRESLLDGIPKSLPLISRAQKILNRVSSIKEFSFISGEKSKEELFGEKLLSLVQEADQEEIDMESVFRRAVQRLEMRYRTFEDVFQKKTTGEDS